MKTQMKIALWVGIMVLLLTACGQLQSAPTPTDTPEPTATATQSPTNTPAVVSTESAAPEEIENYIGLSYPPLPDGLSQGFSMVIQDSNDYGLSLVSDGANRMLWMEKLTNYDSSGIPSWEIQDVLDLSIVETGVILSPDGCFLNGQPDNEIFVIGKNGIILSAWRANTTSNVFEVISTDGIECHSDKAVSLN